MLDWCASVGAAFLPFSPLGRGYLTGALPPGTTFDAGDFRARNPRVTGDALAANTAIIDAVRRVASRLGTSTARVALAWTLAQGDDVVPIPGTKRLRYLEDNVGAADLSLSADDLAELDALPEAVGARY